MNAWNLDTLSRPRHTQIRQMTKTRHRIIDREENHMELNLIIRLYFLLLRWMEHSLGHNLFDVLYRLRYNFNSIEIVWLIVSLIKMLRNWKNRKIKRTHEVYSPSFYCVRKGLAFFNLSCFWLVKKHEITGTHICTQYTQRYLQDGQHERVHACGIPIHRTKLDIPYKQMKPFTYTCRSAF